MRLKLAFRGITVSTAHSGASPKSSPCYASANWAIVCTIVVDKGWNVRGTTLPVWGGLSCPPLLTLTFAPHVLTPNVAQYRISL
jgi:hypothetical protein